MSAIVTSARDTLNYGTGYLSGRAYALPRSFTDLYAQTISKATSLVTLPLPFLSILAVPLFGGSSATLNAFVFYLTWSSLVLSYGELKIEIYGTLALRLICFFLPALAFLAFDAVLPGLSKNIKSRGLKHHPTKLDPKHLVTVATVALLNVILAVALQGSLEILCTKVLHLRSLVKVTKGVLPFPWSIFWDLIWGFIIRGAMHYAVHRYLLHTWNSPLKSLHLNWQHGTVPFSMAAAYDHPLPYLAGRWFPTFLPAYLFRWHVLTWFIFVALTSLEELFIYSGYSVLPSTVILTGMARRTEAHFESINKGKAPVNFGHFGILDFACGTTDKGEPNIMDDFQDEAEKRQFQEKVELAVQDALDGIDRKRKMSGQKDDHGTDGGSESQGNDDADLADKDGDRDTTGPMGRAADRVSSLVNGPRRSGRRKGR